MGLEIVELVMRMEEEFNVEIPDEEAVELVSIGVLDDYLAKRLSIPDEERGAFSRRIIWIIADEFALNPAKLSREDRFVEDLHLG